MKDFRELKVWHKSHELALDAYRVTKKYPREELFGLTSQTRRSSMSIPTNLAEGCGRGGDAELRRFSSIAMGSASELEYQLLLAHDLGFLSPSEYAGINPKIIEVKRMLSSFIQKLTADR